MPRSSSGSRWAALALTGIVSVRCGGVWDPGEPASSTGMVDEDPSSSVDTPQEESAISDLDPGVDIASERHGGEYAPKLAVNDAGLAMFAVPPGGDPAFLQLRGHEPDGRATLTIEAQPRSHRPTFALRRMPRSSATPETSSSHYAGSSSDDLGAKRPRSAGGAAYRSSQSLRICNC